MEPLATQFDIEARLGRTLADDEAIRVEQLLADASANVRRVSSQHFTPGTSTVMLTRSINGRVRLPQRPVTKINSVVDFNGNPLQWALLGDELRVYAFPPINGWEIEPYWYGTPPEIYVDYDHGDAEIPQVIIGVVCSIVMRALGQKPDQAGIIQEQIDGYMVQMGGAAAQGAFGMLASELEICQAFSRPAAPMILMS